MARIWVPSDPHLYRWMMFVDGENLVIRAQKFAENEGIDLLEGPYYKPDVFVWIPGIEGTQRALEEAGKAPRLRLKLFALTTTRAPQAARTWSSRSGNGYG